MKGKDGRVQTIKLLLPWIEVIVHHMTFIPLYSRFQNIATLSILFEHRSIERHRCIYNYNNPHNVV